MTLDKLALLIIQDHPMMGVGANNFPLVMNSYAARGGLVGEFLYTVHNTYLLIWSEIGIGGLIAFVWLLIAIVCQGFRCWQLRDPLFAPLALGCAAAVIGFMVQINFEPVRSGSAVDLMWLFAGLVTAMARMSVSPLAVPQAGVMANRGLARLKLTRS